MRIGFQIIAAVLALGWIGCGGEEKTGEIKNGIGDTSAVKTVIVDSLEGNGIIADTGDTADDFDTLEPDSISIE